VRPLIASRKALLAANLTAGNAVEARGYWAIFFQDETLTVLGPDVFSAVGVAAGFA
jgi:hypothetical protein